MTDLIWPPPDDALDGGRFDLAAKPRPVARPGRVRPAPHARTAQVRVHADFSWPPAEDEIAGQVWIADACVPATPVWHARAVGLAGAATDVVRALAARRLALPAAGLAALIAALGLWPIVSQSRLTGGPDGAASLSSRPGAEGPPDLRLVATVAVPAAAAIDVPTRHGPPIAALRQADARAGDGTLAPTLPGDRALDPRGEIGAAVTARETTLAATDSPPVPALQTRALPESATGPVSVAPRGAAAAGRLAGLPAASPRLDPAATDRAAVRTLVHRYRDAFNRLDVSAAAALWPSADVQALTRAFAGLEQQDVTFDMCAVAVGADQATATCQGALSYVRRVGPSEPRTERYQWTFHLEREGLGWQIAEVLAQ